MGEIVNYEPCYDFCRSCLTFCDTSLLVRFSRIAFKIFEKTLIFCLTVVCLDVWIGESPCDSFYSSIDK